MKGKIYEPEKFNQVLPLLIRIVDDIIRCYREFQVALAAAEVVMVECERENSPEHRLQLMEADEVVKRTLREAQRCEVELENSLGAVPYDRERGIVHFYGDLDGIIVNFCWERDEPMALYRHDLSVPCRYREKIPERIRA